MNERHWMNKRLLTAEAAFFDFWLTPFSTEAQMRFQAAQGDVLVTQIEPQNPALFNVRVVSGPFLVAEGEKEGHKHLLVADDPIEIMLDEVNSLAQRRLVAKIGPAGATLTHDTHAPTKIPANATVEIRSGQVDYDPRSMGHKAVD